MSSSTHSPRRRRILRWIARLSAFLTDGWVILGIALLLIAALEGLYRIQGAARSWLRSDAVSGWDPRHPYADEDWRLEFAEALTEFQKSAARFDSSRGWWPDEFHSRWLNVDRGGVRRTQQAPPGSRPVRRVFMLGGSTMWGFSARDEATIPSLTSAQLRHDGITDVEISNLAQPAFNFSQGVSTLIRGLSQGHVPAIAVFLDGVNEVGVVAYGEAPGDAYNERELRQRTWREGDVAPVVWLADHVQLVHRLSKLLAPGLELGRSLGQVAMGLKPREYRGQAGMLGAEDISARCESIAGRYRNLVVAVQGAAHEYGFRALYYWQPSLANSHKTRGPWERKVEVTPEPISVLSQACLVQIQAVMTGSGAPAGVEFHDLSELFDHHAEDVFLDNFGHVTERAAVAIAGQIAEQIR